MKYAIPSPDTILPACRVIPVVVVHREEETDGMLRAFRDGGVGCVEITFRTDCAAAAIRRAAASFPDMCIGAGTVITGEQAETAISCGASFIVSPGFSDDVATVCSDRSIPYLPGCVTPTEIMHALSCGITTVKFFPADVYGGLSAIKALSAPFPQVKFLPTGGIGFDNLNDYLSCGKVVAVGGSFLCHGDIRANCLRLSEILHSEV
jgi:2-dehydro-3-deoxyphosphogluconate aldolase / (4S)-4-hydroxy-2-oxoglutarate aldolase